jgi:hypothetical protein
MKRYAMTVAVTPRQRNPPSMPHLTMTRLVWEARTCGSHGYTLLGSAGGLRWVAKYL